MTDIKKKILIVGDDSYLSTGLEFNKEKYQTEKIRRPYAEEDKAKYKDFDYIINFCIQPWQFTQLIDESEMIDVQIAKEIKNTKTKFIFLSSRKVYGSNNELKEYKETDELQPSDFYAKNKVAIEKRLQEILTDNLLILRTGNIIGEATRINKNTFIGWLEKELEEKGKVYCTILPETKKDFITRDYFQEVLCAMVDNNAAGIFNVGAGFTVTIKELLMNLLPDNLLDFSKATSPNDQFVLNTNRLHLIVKPFTKESLNNKCSIIKNTFNYKIASEDIK